MESAGGSDHLSITSDRDGEFVDRPCRRPAAPLMRRHWIADRFASDRSETERVEKREKNSDVDEGAAGVDIKGGTARRQ